MRDLTDVARLLLSIRKEGITDSRIQAAFENVPRHLFIPKVFSDQAYDDVALPIACNQTISQPSLVAFMINALEVGERMKVLEIGTGSGYQTAVLSHLCRRIYSIERYRELSLDAVQRLSSLDLSNISTVVGDGSLGWPEQAPFSRIIVSAAATEIPKTLLEHMSDGGIMIIPVGEPGQDQILYRLRKHAHNYERERLLDVRFVPLVSGIE
jgi:protein-L-isoaspartate(D-aspartate) O-methyltransferase